MPSNPEAYLLSSIVRNRDYTVAIAHGLSTDMFHAYADEAAWIEKYFNKYRKTPTKVAFKRRFPDFPLKQVDDTLHFVDEVRKTHVQQELMVSMREATELIAQGEPDKAVAFMSGAIVQVATASGMVKESNIITDWASIYNEVMARKKRFDENGMSGIPSGFEVFDERTGGFQKGQSVVVGARLGEGKSFALLKTACTAMMAGHKVHYASLEMSKVEVGMRLHNILSGSIGKHIFMSMNLAQGKDFDPGEYRNFLRGLTDQIKGSLTVSDSPGIGLLEIQAQMDRYKPDIYLLDYLTLAKTAGDGNWQDIGNFSKGLKGMALSYDVAMVSAAQLNRAEGLGKGISGAEALAQSDAIGQDADLIINLKKRSTTITEYGLVKNRHGRAGYNWFMQMDLKKGVFQDISFNKAQDQIMKDQEEMAQEQENSR